MLKSKLVHNFFWLAQNYNLKKAPNLKIYWKGAKFDILKTAPNLPKENHKSAILKWKFKGKKRRQIRKKGTRRSSLAKIKLPKDEDEEYEEGEEDGHVVHGAQHDEQLAPQVGHEANQLEDA